jgi:hypothetical protein
LVAALSSTANSLYWKDRIMALAGSLCPKSNSIPFGERITCTIVLFAERRIESLKIDRRRLTVVSSLLNLLNAVKYAPLVELASSEGAR